MGALGDAVGADQQGRRDDIELSYWTVQPNKWTFQSKKIRRWVEQRLRGRTLNACADTPTGNHQAAPRDVTVSRSALQTLLDWIKEDPAMDFAPENSEIPPAWVHCQEALGTYVCEPCSFPPGEGVAKLADGTVLCAYHAEAFESGAWDGDEWTLYDLREREIEGEE